jgi:DnaJ domain
MRRSINNGRASVIEKWLERRMFQESLLNATVAIFSFFFGMALLVFTFFAVCVAAFTFYPDKKALLNWIYDGSNAHLKPLVLMEILAGLFVIIILAAYALSRRKHPNDLRYGYWHRGRRYPGYTEHGIVRDFADLLFAGPILLIASVDFFKHALRQDQLEIKACAQILLTLLSRNSRFSYTELTRRTNIPNSMRVFPQLREIEGVVFLKADPPGLSLTADLRAELFDLFEDAASEPEPAPVEEPSVVPDPNSPYVLLGITEPASLKEIKTAYRQRIKECHPDKFASLGSEWRALAEERAKQLNAAYEALIAGFAGKTKGM